MKKFDVLGKQIILYTWGDWSPAKRCFIVLGGIPITLFSIYAILASYEMVPNILIFLFGM